MQPNTSPLSALAAFAIAFASGVVSLYGLGRYTAKVRRDARNGISQ